MCLELTRKYITSKTCMRACNSLSSVNFSHSWQPKFDRMEPTELNRVEDRSKNNVNGPSHKQLFCAQSKWLAKARKSEAIKTHPTERRRKREGRKRADDAEPVDRESRPKSKEIFSAREQWRTHIYSVTTFR